MGTVDRILRALIAAIIAVLYFSHVINGTAAIILLSIAGIFLLTSIAGFCPLYLPFKFSTRKQQ